MQPNSPALPDDFIHFLHRVSIFSELEPEALKEVAQKLKPLALPKGAIVYREGDPGDALYIIRSGRVRVIKELQDGREKLLNYLGRGDTLGETTLLTGAVRTITVKVDTNANFLVLYKSDFEDFLKRNPAASFYLSRLLSQRLLVAFESTLAPRTNQELLGFYCNLPKEDHIVFVCNLGITLTEQLRRKILLLELGPYGHDLLKAMGIQPGTNGRTLREEDFRNPKALQRMTHIHPSGLEIITLNDDQIAADQAYFIPTLCALMRENYDYVIINVHGLSDSGMESRRQDIPRAFLAECDSLHHVRSEPAFHPGALNEVVEPDREFKKIVLGTAAEGESADFTVPWTDATVAAYRRGARPYFNTRDTEGSQKVLGRIARAIGKLQVGLALGSGAAYGYTIIGILKVFERERIPVDFVSGTSMGALIGSFYAAGKNTDELEEIANSITKIWLRKNFFSDLNLPWPHGGLLMGHTVSKFLRGILGEVEFPQLPTPFACAATDIVTGDSVVMREGKVWEAVRASLSLPFIFRPYKMGERFLVDGGLVSPVPTSIIASMGADILVSVNLTNKVAEKKVWSRMRSRYPDLSPGIFTILFKMIYTMQYQIAQSRMDLSHVMIRPDTKNVSWGDFHKASAIIPLGIDAAEEHLTKIKARLPFFSDYCRVTLRK